MCPSGYIRQNGQCVLSVSNNCSTENANALSGTFVTNNVGSGYYTYTATVKNGESQSATLAAYTLDANTFNINVPISAGATGQFTTQTTTSSFEISINIETSCQNYFNATPNPISTSFTYTPSSPTAGQAVTFTATASGGTSPYSYTWSFGDGSYGSGSVVSHAFVTSGSYSVKVTTTDSASLSGSYTQTVAVSSAPIVYACNTCWNSTVTLSSDYSTGTGDVKILSVNGTSSSVYMEYEATGVGTGGSVSLSQFEIYTGGFAQYTSWTCNSGAAISSTSPSWFTPTHLGVCSNQSPYGTLTSFTKGTTYYFYFVGTYTVTTTGINGGTTTQTYQIAPTYAVTFQ